MYSVLIVNSFLFPFIIVWWMIVKIFFSESCTMLRLIFPSLCFVAVQCAIQRGESGDLVSGSCEESKHKILSRSFVCEVTRGTSRSVEPCKRFKAISEKMIQDPSVTDNDGVRYTIKNNKVFAVNTDGQTYSIVLGPHNKYAPIVLKVNQEKNMLYILASVSGECPKKGGLFVLKTDLIVPNMNGQIVIRNMEDLGENFRWLEVSEYDEIELLVDADTKLTLNPNADDPC